MNTLEQLQFTINSHIGLHVHTIITYVSNFSDAEFDKIEVIEVSEIEKVFIEKHGHVIRVSRSGESVYLYSVGGMPFKIKLIEK